MAQTEYGVWIIRMDVKALKRDPVKARSYLKQIGDALVTTRDCTIQIPESYAARNLAVMGSEVYVCGVFPIVFDDGTYTLNSTIAMFRIKPAVTETTVIDGENYYEFKFEAGDTLIANTNLVVSNTLVYYVYNHFIANGNIPWFLELYDLVNLFASTKEHAGVNLGTKATMEVIIMTMVRDSEDLHKLYKHNIESDSDLITRPPTIIAFDSVIWNTSDTTSKLNGNYHSDAVNAALVNRSERVEMIEELLRT